MTRFLPALVALLFAGAAVAGDAPLTEDQASRFVDTLPTLDKLGEELEAEGKFEEFKIDNQPKAGEPFAPYSDAVANLKKNHPADHARLVNAVRPHGFSADEWGAVGDRVIIAYLALEMEEDDPRSMQMMDGMDQSMMEMMPPEMRAQLESVFAMMETVKNAPEADKKVVAGMKDRLDAHMEPPASP
ncbi:MAG: hypothetical protein AAFW81_06700 [Pseudomonadota bacterium]